MNDIIKETIKKQLSDKSKEELLDMCAGFCADVMWLNFSSAMAYSDTQVTTQQTKAVMDAINGDFNEVTKILCRTDKIVEGWAKIRKDINLYDTKEEADRKMIGNDEYVTAKVCWEE